MDRPMNEYESALMAALIVLVQAIAKIDKPALVQHLRSAATAYTDRDHKHGAAILEMLALMAESDQALVSQSPFEIIQGGKTDLENSN
jgi:hypothetical protein